MADIEFVLPKNQSNVIKVIGVGGGGSNAVNHMFTQGIKGVDYVICNTDAQALENSRVPNRVQLGASLTEGLGAGADPDIGKRAAEESIEELKNMLETNTKMVFITAGMGGGTGTGAAPIIAEISKDMGILTVAIVTIPFIYEGRKRREQALKGIENLKKNVDSLIVINNNKLSEIYGDLGYKAAYAKADEVLSTAAKGIAEVISKHYMQNIDLRDARTVLEKSGTAIMGSAIASGENRAKEAVIGALNSPLLNDNRIVGAKNVLLLIVSGTSEVTHSEILEINHHIQNEAKNEVDIIMGIGDSEDLGDSISVTVIATGFNPDQEEKIVNTEPRRIIHTLVDEQEVTHDLTRRSETICHMDDVEDLFFEDEIEEELVVMEKEEVEEDPIFSMEVDYEWLNPKELEFSKEKKELKKEMVEKPVRTTRFDIFEAGIKSKESVKEKKQQISLEAELEFPPKVDPLTTSIQTFESIHKKERKDEQLPEEKKYFTLEEYEQIENQLCKAEAEEDTEEIRFEVREVPKEEIPATNIPIVSKFKTQELVNEDEKTIDPIHNSIEESLKKTTQQRKKVFKSFNYQFSSQANLEDKSEPAYLRQGIVLEDIPSGTKASRTTINEDANGNIQIRKNNSFLHDNAD